MNFIFDKAKNTYCVFSLFVITIIFSSCNNSENITHKYVHIDTLSKVMVDMYITDGVLATADIERNRKDSTVYYKYIFEKYNINKSQFDSAIQILSRNPEIYVKVYEDVIRELTKMEGEVNVGLSQEKENKKKNKIEREDLKKPQKIREER